MTFAPLSPVSDWLPAAPSDSCTAGLRLCFAQHKSFPERGGVPSVPESSLGSLKGKQQRGNHYITQPILSAEGDEVIKSEMGSIGKRLMRFLTIRLLIATAHSSGHENVINLSENPRRLPVLMLTK